MIGKGWWGEGWVSSIWDIAGRWDEWVGWSKGVSGWSGHVSIEQRGT
jgi:hypothetical protein